MPISVTTAPDKAIEILHSSVTFYSLLLYLRLISNLPLKNHNCLEKDLLSFEHFNHTATRANNWRNLHHVLLELSDHGLYFINDLYQP